MTTARNVTEVCDELETLTRRLRDQLPGMARRASVASAAFDGYPSRTLGPGGGGGGGPSDPVGNRVVSILTPRPPRADGKDEPEADPVKAAVARAVSSLYEARRHLRAADDERHRVVQLQTPDRASVAADPSQGCVNCARFDVWSTIHKAMRCVACYGWRRRHDGADAPEHIVMARPEVAGRRRRVIGTDVA